MLKTLFICGKFDYAGGKPSKIGQTIAENFNTRPYISIVNGGHFVTLLDLFETIEQYERIVWLAQVPVKTSIKTVEWIKQQHNTCILITSKINIDDKYSFNDIVQESKQLRSNLIIEFIKKEGLTYGRIIDPLGNVYLDFTRNFEKLGKVLDLQSNFLSTVKREISYKHGDVKPIPSNPSLFKIIEKYDDITIAFKDDNEEMVYISGRNTPPNEFVAIEIGLPVFYYGDIKPNIHTPVDIKLFQYYSNVKYIIHSHNYIKDIAFTDEYVPCGSLQEFKQITNIAPKKEAINFSVNLLNHGSITIASDLKSLRSIKYYTRKIPEQLNINKGF